MKRFTLILSLMCTCASSLAAYQDSLSEQQLQALLANEILVVDETPPGSSGKSFRAYALIPASIAEVSAVLRDYEAYVHFMPDLSRIDIQQRGDDSAVVDQYLSLPLGQSRQYRVRISSEASGDSHILRWQMMPWPELPQEKTIKDTRGYWKLTPYRHMVLVDYFVYTDPGHIPLGLGWIVNKLTRDSIPTLLSNTRTRVLSIRGQSGQAG